MSKLTAAIIEDEVPAARLLSSIITRLRPDWEVTVLPGSVEEAIVWFRTHSHPDILFLDIQLSDGNSFDFLSAAQPSSLIIFTTAYDQYAIRAFTVNSIDYILKPVDEKRLLDAIVKYETLKGKDYKQENYIGDLIQSLQKQEKSYRTRFLIAGDAQDAAHAFRVDLAKSFGDHVAQTVRVLYGGSVSSKNCVELIEEPDVDGFLIGGAALDVDELTTICRKTIATTSSHDNS